MKYVVSWTARGLADNEAAFKRSLQVFNKWSPPEGDVFSEFLQRVDGTGGYAIVESDNPLNLLDSAAKFGAWFQFEVVPVVDIADGMQVISQAVDWLDGVS